MGARIEWFHDAWRVGAVRFGPAFTDHRARHAYEGAGLVLDLYRDCYLAAFAGRMTGDDRAEILRDCAANRFERAFVERHGGLWVYDLASADFKRRRADYAELRLERHE